MLAARSSRTERSRSLPASAAAAANCARASSVRPSRASSSPRTLGSRCERRRVPAAASPSTIASAAFLPPNTIWKDPQRYIDAKLSYKFKNGLQLQFEARNLTGTRYSESQNFSGNQVYINRYDLGRVFSLGITAQF